MSEEIKKTEQTELSEQELAAVAGGAPDMGKFKFTPLPGDDQRMKLDTSVVDPKLVIHKF